MNTSTLYIIFLSVIAVGILADLFQRKIKYLNKYVIPFGISFVLSLIFIHILPELFHTNNKLIGLFFVIGFALQLLLELLSKGIEHGHIHAPKDRVGAKLLLPLTSSVTLWPCFTFHALLRYATTFFVNVSVSKLKIRKD